MQKNLFFFLLVIVLFSSCRSYRHIYSPAPANNPFFTDKGDGQIGFFYSGGDGNQGIGTRDKNEGIDILAAYAIGNEFAITSSHFSRKERDLYPNDYYDTSTVNYNRKLTDVGIGWFKAFDSRKTITFNLYTGLGFGKFSIKDNGLDNTATSYSRYHSTRVRKWFLQSSFNFFPGKNFRIGIVNRFSFIRYSNIQTNYTNDEQVYFHLDRINKRTIATLEPSMNLQFGILGASWLKTEASLALASNWNANFPATRTINASIGVVLSLPPLAKDNKKSTDQK